MLTLLMALVLAVGPSTQPATAPSAEAELRKINLMLREQIAALKKQNAAMEVQIAQLKSQIPATRPAAPQGVSTFTSRTEAYYHTAAVNYTSKQDIDRDRKTAAALDARIAAYVLANNVPDDVANSLYRGRPLVGMTEDEITLMGRFLVQSEDTSSKQGNLDVWSAVPETYENGVADLYDIVIVDGKVSQISRRAGVR